MGALVEAVVGRVPPTGGSHPLVPRLRSPVPATSNSLIRTCERRRHPSSPQTCTRCSILRRGYSIALTTEFAVPWIASSLLRAAVHDQEWSALRFCSRQSPRITNLQYRPHRRGNHPPSRHPRETSTQGCIVRRIIEALKPNTLTIPDQQTLFWFARSLLNILVFTAIAGSIRLVPTLFNSSDQN